MSGPWIDTGPVLPQGPWLVDSEGNDVFDSVNNPLEPGNEYIFDEVDAEQSLNNLFGDVGGDIGSGVDDADQFLRDVLATHPATGTGDSLAEMLRDIRDVGATDPWDPNDGVFTTTRFKLLLLAGLGIAGLVAIGPALQGIGQTADAISTR